MIRIMFAMFALMLTANEAAALTYEEARANVIKLERDRIGKTYWISKPQQKGLHVCARRWGDCKYVSDIKLTVLDAGKGNPIDFVKIRLASGSIGYVSTSETIHFYDPEPSPDLKEKISTCEFRGAPQIGASKLFTYQCLGLPSRTNITETASGTVEQMIYDGQAYVYIEQGRVKAVQTFR